MVCTGNICRSPLAERLLAAELSGRGVAATVTSAGLVTEGAAAAPPILAMLADRGIDGSTHVSRRLDAGVLAGIDLVLGMARQHVREAVLADPDGFGRTFTLKELVRRGSAVGRRSPGETLAAWLARAGAGRRPSDVLGDSRDDDIVDPIGRRAAVYRQVGDEISALTVALADLAWPLAAAGPRPVGAAGTAG